MFHKGFISKYTFIHILLLIWLFIIYKRKKASVTNPDHTQHVNFIQKLGPPYPTVQYTLQTVHCTESTLYRQYTVQTVHCTDSTLYKLYTVQTVHCTDTDSTLYRQYTVQTVHRTDSTPYRQYTVQFKLYTVHTLLYSCTDGTVHCTDSTLYSTLWWSAGCTRYRSCYINKRTRRLFITNSAVLKCTTREGDGHLGKLGNCFYFERENLRRSRAMHSGRHRWFKIKLHAVFVCNGIVKKRNGDFKVINAPQKKKSR